MSLHDLRDAFTDEHVPMYVLLGLVAALERVTGSLRPSDASDAEASGFAYIDQPMALLLGLVKLRSDFVAMRAAVTAERDAVADADVLPTESLLR